MPTILPSEPIPDEPIELEQGSSLWRDAWHRLSKNKIAVFGGVTLIVLTLACIFGPLLSSYSYEDQNLNLGASAPSMSHWLGTDTLGRDLLVRLLVGGRISIGVGLCATLVALTIGVVYGATAGFFGGKTDAFMMRIVDIMYALPFTIFVILLMVFFGRNIVLLFVAIGAVEWLTMARIVRGQIMSIKKMEFIEAARSIAPDHLPPHDSQCARTDHRLHDPDHPRRDAARSLPQLPRSRCATAAQLVGRADQGWGGENGRVLVAPCLPRHDFLADSILAQLPRRWSPRRA